MQKLIEDIEELVGEPEKVSGPVRTIEKSPILTATMGLSFSRQWHSPGDNVRSVVVVSLSYSKNRPCLMLEAIERKATEENQVQESIPWSSARHRGESTIIYSFPTPKKDFLTMSCRGN